MAPPENAKRRRRHSKKRTSSSEPRRSSQSEEPQPEPPPQGRGAALSSPANRKGHKSPQKADKSKSSGLASEVNCNTRIMPQKENKLDNFCQMLEKMVIQHGGKDAMSDSAVKCSSPQKTTNKSSKSTPVKLPQNVKPSTSTGPSVNAPVPVNAPPSTSAVSDAPGERPREEIEQERKARKEAKKAKKKDSNKSTETKQEASQDNSPQHSVQKNSTTAANSVVGPAAGHKGESLGKPQQGPQKQPEAQNVAPGKSKADLKRERREKQEAQRKAKIEAKAKMEEEKQQKGKERHPNDTAVAKKTKPAGEGVRRGRVKKAQDKLPSDRRIPLLGHLPPYSPSPPPHLVNSDSIHPAVLTLGLKMKCGVVEGATARVVSMLAAFKRFISDYRTPESCDLSRDMAERLKPNVAFLSACRPHAIAMDNAIRSVKHKINSIGPAMPEAQAKDELRDAIDQYVQENITLAGSTIASHATSLIHDDVLLTFGYSALVCDVVEAVVKGGGKVSVVVADSPHPPSGAAMVKRLSVLGIPTYYRLITDITQVMSKVTKVVVEAEAVMMNGAVQAACGTASLALAAATHHKPFIVLCQTYKFCNMDLTDSLVVNELGDADSVVSCPSKEHCGLLTGWQDTHSLNVVRLVYDVTPASLVTVLVTEQSVLPTSAVPVIIHRKYADILGQD